MCRQRGRGDTAGIETQPHAAHGRQTKWKEDISHGTAHTKHLRGLDAEADGTARPSGRTAAGNKDGGTTARPHGKHPPFRQSGPVHAAPDKQAHTATLPQRRCIALQDTGQENLLQRGGCADIPFQPYQGLQKRRYSLLQGSYP